MCSCSTIFVTDVRCVGIWSQINKIMTPKIESLAGALPMVMMRARELKTTRSYQLSFQKWKKWCQDIGISTLPAKEEYVCLYLIKVLQESSSPAGMDQAFYALKWAHDVAGIPNPCEMKIVKLCLEGCKRVLAKPKKKKEPITSEIIENIVLRFGSSQSNLYDLRGSLLCVLGFAGFLRYSELAHLRRCDICFFDNYMKIFIEKSKTDVYRDGNWVLIAKTGNVTCPVCLLKRYLSSCGMLDNSESEMFIFRSLSYLKKSNSYMLRKENHSLSYTRTREILLSMLSSLGLNTKLYGLHSLRSGGASKVANMGVSDRMFKRHGRWKSETAKDGYVKDSLKDMLSVSLNLGL